MKKILFTISLFLVLISTSQAANLTQYKFTSTDNLYSTYKEVNGATYSTESAYRIYDFFDEEGLFNNVYTSEGNVYWSKYDEKMNLISTYSWPLYYKGDDLNTVQEILFKPFGGAVYYNNYLYVFYTTIASGSSLTEQYSKNVLALGKYDKTGNLVDLKEYKGVDLNASSYYDQTGTQVPFYTSNNSIAVNDGVIALFFGRNMFNSHQSSLIAFFDANDLEYLSNMHDKEALEWERRQPYVNTFSHSIGHSLAQRIITTSDGGYLLAEAGDAGATRGMMVTKLYNYNDSEYGNYFNLTTKRMFHYSEGSRGLSGNNILNSIMGNILELEDGYLYVGAMDPVLSSDYGTKINNPYQIVVQKYDKSFYIMDDSKAMQLLDTPTRVVTGQKPEEVDSSTPLYLTGDEVDYGLKFLTNEKEYSPILVRAVKMDNDNVAIIWEQDKVNYNDSTIYLSTSNYETYYMVIDKDANILVNPTKLENAVMSGEENYVYKDGFIYWTSIQGRNITINKLNPLNFIEEVHFTKSEVELEYNTSMKLDVTITPSDAFDKTLQFTSSNPNIVSVDNSGNITAKYPGEAIITVKTSNNKSASIKVVVTGEVLYLKGDMNQNGKIDLTDILILIKLYFNKLTPNDYYEIVGDMNSNDRYDLTDILILIKTYFGKV